MEETRDPNPQQVRLFGGLLDAFEGPPQAELPRVEEFRLVRTFDEALEETDPFSLLLRAHLWIERALHDSILANGIRNPADYEDLRLGFANTVRLALALGVLPRIAVPAFLALNKLRNRLAHEPRFVLEEGAIRDFVNAALPDLRKRMDCEMVRTLRERGITHNPNSLIMRFRSALRMLHFIADLGRIRAEDRRRRQIEEADRVGRLLAKMCRQTTGDSDGPVGAEP